MAIRLVIYTLAMVVLIYLTEIFLPDTLKLNANISIGIFVVVVMIFFKVSKDKWWMKLVSAVLGVVVFMLLIALLAS